MKVVTKAFNKMYAATCRGMDKIDLIPVDNQVWATYMSELQDHQRFQGAEMAKRGFTTVKYMDADVVLDGGVGGNMPARTAYGLNTDYIHYRPHVDKHFVPLSPDRFATNQDALVKLTAWAGIRTLSNAELQGRVGFSA